MKVGVLTIFASAMLLAGVSLSGAQQPPPQPPPQAPSVPPAPAALSVPDPLAGFRSAPRDLYRSPDGSDRFKHGSLYPPPPLVIGPIYPGPIYPGTYYPFGHAYGTTYYGTSMAETYRMSMAESYLRRQREPARGSLVLESVAPMAQVYADGHYVGLAEAFGPGGGALNLTAGAHQIAHLQRHDRAQRPRALSRRHAADHHETGRGYRTVPSCAGGGEKFLRHSQLLRR
jgi:hypothetical protein